MKKDNLFLNFEPAEEAVYNGTISYNEEIVKLQKSDAKTRGEYIAHLIAPSLSEDSIKYMIYTHMGRFHADEVFSTALILLARNTIANNDAGMLEYITSAQIKSSVKRVKSIADVTDPLDKCVVLDLLDGHYDHHHKNPKDRKDYPDYYDDTRKEEWTKPLKMATFGALWSDIGHIFDLENVKTPNKNVWELILVRFILPMDQQDNYGPNYYEAPISKVISNMNTYSDFEKGSEYDNFEELDFRFIEAVKMAYTILRNEIMSMQKLVQSVKDIKENKNVSAKYLGDVVDPYNTSMCPIYGIEISKVNEGETAPIVMIEAVNETEIECPGGSRIVHPHFIMNRNPDSRDGSYRLILGRYIKLDPKEVLEECGSLVKFIHPNDGFLVSFETEEKMEKFLNEHFLDLVKFQ